MAFTFNWSNTITPTTNYQQVTTFNVGSTNANAANGAFHAGDFLLAVVTVFKTTDPGAIGVAGFTQIVQAVNTNGYTRTYVGYKIAGGSETGSYAATWTSTSTAAGWILASWSGVASSNMIDASGVTLQSAYGTSLVAPSISPTGATDLLLTIFSTNGAVTTLSTPAGTTNRASCIGANSIYTSVIVNELQLAASGPTATQTSTAGNSQNYSNMISIALLPGAQAPQPFPTPTLTFQPLLAQ